MVFRLIVLLMVAFYAAPAQAEVPVRADEMPESEQSDIYYTAMLRSIDLDKTRWKAFSRSIESGPWFYDTGDIKRQGTKVTAMVTVFPHPQKTEIYRSVFSEHTNIRKIVFETEINCARAAYRQPLIRVFGYDKELLAEHSHTKSFSPIKPGTTTDTLRNLVCGPGKKKKGSQM